MVLVLLNVGVLVLLNVYVGVLVLLHVHVGVLRILFLYRSLLNDINIAALKSCINFLKLLYNPLFY